MFQVCSRLLFSLWCICDCKCLDFVKVPAILQNSPFQTFVKIYRCSIVCLLHKATVGKYCMSCSDVHLTERSAGAGVFHTACWSWWGSFKIITGLRIVALYFFHSWCTLSTLLSLLLLHTQHSSCCHHTRETGLISPHHPPPTCCRFPVFLLFFLGVVGDWGWSGWGQYGGSHTDSLGL